MIFELSWKEPEVIVKYRVCVGIEALACAWKSGYVYV